MPPKFMENIVILCFERPNVWAGYATGVLAAGEQKRLEVRSSFLQFFGFFPKKVLNYL